MSSKAFAASSIRPSDWIINDWPCFGIAVEQANDVDHYLLVGCTWRGRLLYGRQCHRLSFGHLGPFSVRARLARCLTATDAAAHAK